MKVADRESVSRLLNADGNNPKENRISLRTSISIKCSGQGNTNQIAC